MSINFADYSSIVGDKTILPDASDLVRCFLEHGDASSHRINQKTLVRGALDTVGMESARDKFLRKYSVSSKVHERRSKLLYNKAVYVAAEMNFSLETILSDIPYQHQASLVKNLIAFHEERGSSSKFPPSSFDRWIIKSFLASTASSSVVDIPTNVQDTTR